MFSDVMLPPHPPHPNVIAGSRPVVMPTDPCVVGVFTTLRFDDGRSGSVHFGISKWSTDYQRKLNADIRLLADPSLAIPELTRMCGKLIGKEFRSYWRSRGGLAIFGLPIGEARLEGGGGEPRQVAPAALVHPREVFKAAILARRRCSICGAIFTRIWIA